MDTETFDQARNNAALALFDAGAVKFGDFVLKNGSRSPIYVDMRVMQSHPAELETLAAAMNYLVHPTQFERLVAIPHGATPLTVVMSQLSGVPMLTSREGKEHGTGGKVDGDYRENMIVAVIDDLITDGASKLGAYPPLLEAKLKIGGTFVVVDRLQGGAQVLQEKGYSLIALWPLDELIDFYHEAGLFRGDQFNIVSGYISRNRP